MLPFEGDESVQVEVLLRDIELASAHGVEGITLLGGEPFAHADVAAVLAREVQKRGLSVMDFSGFSIERLRAMPEATVGELLRHVIRAEDHVSSRSDLVEAVVRTLVGDECSLNAESRLWTDGDEFLVRRRAHRHVKEAMKSQKCCSFNGG